MAPTFAEDLTLFSEHGEPIELASEDGSARLALSAAYQGRVLTSTLDGAGGRSLGWVDRAQIAAGERTPHMTVWGGEDRFWVGPEGGQHGLYFAPGAAFDYEHWQVPEAVDWGAWEPVPSERGQARFRRLAQLRNWSGTCFDVALEREVRLLGRRELAALLGLELTERVRAVAFQSDNALSNAGAEPWTRERGLPSIWTVGMFPASAACTVVVPFLGGDEDELGPAVRSDYFHPPGPDRLAVDEELGALFLRADGRLRCKLGVPRARARPWLGAWDDDTGLLTLVHFDLPEQGDYVDSRWKRHADPFGGDVVNAYNDGAHDAGTGSLGSFFELETSSPVRALEPGGELRHLHRTVHLAGPESALERVARATLGVGLDDVRAALV